MTTNQRLARATPSTPLPLQDRLERPVTLEGAGIYPGSSLLLSPEEQEQHDAEERERSDTRIALLDAALASVYQCRCCGGVAGLGASGLCTPCRSVIAQLVAERHAGEIVNGRSRSELAADYLAREVEREAS
jgi:hypothetical protein